MTTTEISILISLAVLLVMIVGLFLAIKRHEEYLQKSNKIHQDQLMHDMVKEEISNWKYIHEQKEKYGSKGIPDAVKSHIFNYYEYLAYLINYNKLNSREARILWKSNILGMFKQFPDEFLKERDELKKLYWKWKKEE